VKVLVMTLGTRGDVQPFVALARALDAAGHEAVVCGPHRFEDFVVGHGIRFAGVDDGPMRQLDSPAEAGNVIQGGVRARLRQVRSMPGMFNQVLTDCWRVASAGAGAGAQAIVHNGQILAGQHLGEALGVPAVLGLPIPMYVPTAAFPWAGQALPTWWPARLNRASYGGMKMLAVMFGRVIDQWRSDTLRLKPRPGRHDPTRNPDGTAAVVLHAYSPAVLPRPDDWPAAALVTGYWFLDDNSTLPADVQQFLADGPAPVFAGFGSMTGLDPVQTATAVVDAAAIAEERLILATGWGGLDTEAAKAAAGRTGVDLCVVDNVDYRGQFPRVSTVVHHGGAGTTGTAFAAGRPQVVCPFVADQPFWARIAQEHGVAPDPLPQRSLTSEALAERLVVAQGAEARAAATGLGDRIAAEDGLAVAVAAIEQATTLTGSAGST
jgi:sterol 3beta-glucosyltransferase